MSINIPIGSWLVPAAVTVIAFLFCCWVAYRERGSTGLLAGLGFAVAGIASAFVVVVTWITWAVTYLMK
jgi:hypothetical protein